jgi:carboxymethylenebutenolidase
MSAKGIFLASALALIATQAFSQDWAKEALNKSPRHGEYVTIEYGGRKLDAFVVYPERKDKAPVVLVIHEIFGLTDWARDMADQIAAAGYIAVAPDLLSGKGPKGGGFSDFADVDSARGAVSKLDPDGVTADLNAAAEYAKKLPSANGKLAVAGFCWGGGQSFRFASDRKDLSAAFVFYGPPPQDVAKVNAPVYGFYGGNDARISATVPDTAAAMQKAKKSYDAATYKGAGHGFMRSGEDPKGRPEDKAAHDKAWKRFLSLLKKI